MTPAARRQTALLRRLLGGAARTAFGRAHGFAEALRSDDVVRAFQDRVPIGGFDTHAADVDRIRRGEPDVRWPGVVRAFAVSSGTASAGRVLPRSAEHVRRDVHFALRVAATWARNRRTLALLGGRTLTVPGHVAPDPDRPDALVGEVSGLVAHAAPGWVRRRGAVPPVVFDDPDWDRRLDRIADAAAAHDVRLVSLVPSWAPVLFPRVRDAHRRRTGRAAVTLADVWPNLRVIVTGGVALAPYRDGLREEAGHPIDLVETYGASEGFFAFADDPARTDLRLDLRAGVFFEFVPFDRLGDPAAPRFTVGEVAPGVAYVPHVSTCSGLWAYGVGDVVRFTQTDPPRLVVAGRTREVLDRYGEAVYAEEIAAAFAAACAHAGAAGGTLHVASDGSGDVPFRRWFAAFARPPAGPAAFAADLDARVSAANRHYAVRRASGAFGPPVLHALDEADFAHALGAVRGADGMQVADLGAVRGRVGAQAKVPRVADGGPLAAALLARTEAGERSRPTRDEITA